MTTKLRTFFLLRNAPLLLVLLLRPEAPTEMEELLVQDGESHEEGIVIPKAFFRNLIGVIFRRILKFSKSF